MYSTIKCCMVVIGVNFFLLKSLIFFNFDDVRFKITRTQSMRKYGEYCLQKEVLVL